MHQLVKKWTARAVAAVAALFVVTSLALAQAEVKKSPFGVGPAPVTSSKAVSAPVGSSGFWGWMMATQQHYQREMATAVRGLKTASPMAAALSLAFISFMYGVLHAAGPGHGKAVISSYVLANRQTMRRGIALSFLSAFFQACSAIIMVAVLALALKATSLTMKAAESWIEIASWALVALVGVWLLYRQVKPMLAGPAAHDHEHNHVPADLVSAGHIHGPGCGHDHAPLKSSPRVAFPAPEKSAAKPHVHGPGCAHEHDHKHVHSAACCGHAHMPEPSQLQGPWEWSKAISLAMTIGIRPCTGALLVLLFALSQGILWAGIFATFMMSLGTALTVSALAALAVGSRDLAMRLAGKESAWAGRVETAVGIGGALLVILLGTAGFLVALRGPAPF
ncbi:MAG: nickel transporter [Hyphomicrobiaceae bacterium]